MKRLFTLLSLLVVFGCRAQEETRLKDLLNHVVGGTWTSTNKNNEGKPEDYKSFYMSFKNWADDSSVTGSIFGVKNSGDTSQLIEIWNFIDQSKKNLFYVQRTTWGWYATGTINLYQEKHLDIQFKTITQEGQQFFTRDLHYIDSENKMRAVTYHKSKEEDEWQEASQSTWTRK